MTEPLRTSQPQNFFDDPDIFEKLSQINNDIIENLNANDISISNDKFNSNSHINHNLINNLDSSSTPISDKETFLFNNDIIANKTRAK